MKRLLIIIFVLMGITSFSYEKLIDEEMGLIFERDVEIKMRDGTVLYGNVFRPIEEGRYPVIASMGPYGKDLLPVKYDSDEGEIDVSRYAAFEVVDPADWVPEGYVVVNVDSRGTWNSGGAISVFSQKEAEDFYDIIQWAGEEGWSNGMVATSGVSYFAISQWRVAELSPPHLKAIIPWEGLTDIYRDAVYHGGIEEKGFIRGWYKKVASNKRPGSIPEDFIGGIQSNTLYGDFYSSRTPDLSKVTVPAFIVSSWSDHGLHSRGTIEGFKNISSRDKWLYIHGTKKWEFFYSEEGVAEQKRFLDYYLKGVDTGMMDVPRVRYAVREKFYIEDYHTADNYPLNNVARIKLYLDNNEKALSESKVLSSSQRKTSKKTRFTYTFTKDTTLVGGMTLMTYISTSKSEDADIFVGVDKFNADGKKVSFQGNDTEKGHVASGWLRLSQRRVDWSKSEKDRVFLAHDEVQKVIPKEVVQAYVEILPSGTLFKKGESISLVISNKDLKGAGDISHVNINRGKTMVHTGGEYQSYLEIPVLK